MNLNKHIEEYLKYYCSLKVAPNYAVMLRGKWGCGKTWFINNFIKDNSKFKFLYVSLNGIAKTKEIEDDFFRQLHPLLSSKGMKLAGKLFKGLVKTTIKLDLTGDGKDDASVSSAVPEIELTEFFKDADGRILVFDDLERCSIPAPQILGYINQFVENFGLKVIVISNEEEIIDKPDEKPYRLIKEKLFGRSFDISADIDSALGDFIKQVNGDSVQDLLNQKITEIASLYKSSGYDNLRQLRQTILDFARFVELLPGKALEIEELFIKLLSLFFAISFELGKGVLTESQIDELLTFQFLPKSEENQITNIGEIKRKYSVFDSYQHPLDAKLWREYFRTGILNSDELKENIEKNYFKKENTPEFIRLWHQYDLEDNEFKPVYESVYKRFKRKEILDKYELLHVIGILLSLSDQRLILPKKDSIIKQAKKSVRFLSDRGLLSVGDNEEFPGFGVFGLGYTYKESLEFKEIVEYFNSELVAASAKNQERESVKLLEIFRKSVYDFLGEVILNNHTNSTYYRKPVLKYISVRDFMKAYLSHSNRNKKHFAWRFSERYRWPDSNKELMTELPWLKNVLKMVEVERKKRKTKISGSNLEFFIEALKKSITILEPTTTSVTA